MLELVRLNLLAPSKSSLCEAMHEENLMTTALENFTMADQPTFVNIDPEGDMRLIVDYEDAKTKSREFVVSSQVMCLASPV